MALMREIKAGEFKTHCLALLDEVAETGEPIVVTKRGKAVAQLVPIVERPASLIGCLKGRIHIVDSNDDLEPDVEDQQAVRDRFARLEKDLARTKRAR
jgi:prevent-host-death family protein